MTYPAGGLVYIANASNVEKNEDTLTYTFDVTEGDTIILNPYQAAGEFTADWYVAPPTLVDGDNAVEVQAGETITWTYTATDDGSLEVTLGDAYGSIYFVDAEGNEKKTAYKVEITEVSDMNGDGAVDLTDVEYLIQNNKNVLSALKGNGDFRSLECIELLKEADIVVTNPPFSLFREYIAQLMEHDKKFLIIGNVNAITYKEVFPLIKNNKIWLGPSITSGDRKFNVPNDYPLNAASCGIDPDGRHYIRVKGVRWFTNLDHSKRHEEIDLICRYSPEEYPTYDNYNAIEVCKTANIPNDYEGIMGVPVTFLDKYCPEQFEICGITENNKRMEQYWKLSDLKHDRPYIKGKRIFPRILIRNKNPKKI
jgi:hypothetical protein